MSDAALQCILAGASQEIFVSAGNLQLRQRGPWLARELACSSKVAPALGSRASLVLTREDGTQDTFAGVVRRATSDPGDETLTLALVGGAGGLLQRLPVLDHVQTPTSPVTVGLVARAICDAAGETLAPGVELALDVVVLPRWHRADDVSAAVALDLLAWYLSTTTGTPYLWRVLGSGQVWLGAETWAAVAGTASGAYWTGIDPEDGAVLYSLHGAPFLPGQAVDGLQVVEAWYTIGGDGLDVHVRGAIPGDPPHIVDLDLYRGSYSGTVVQQRDDGTIDVRCDDPRIGDLRRLALRVGLPGCTVTVDPTTDPPPRVRVRFDGASPAGAYAADLDQVGLGPSPVLRAGDLVEFVFDPGVPGTFPPALYYTTDGGSTFTSIAKVAPGSTVGGTVPPPFGTPTTRLSWRASSRTNLA